MASKLLSNTTWALIEPLVAEPRSEGRPPVDPRLILTTILLARRFGIAWRELPSDLGCSYKTYLRHRRRWQERGVWEAIEALLDGAGEGQR